MSKLSVHQRKARTFIQREDWGNALAELERVLSADGDNPTLHNQIGDVYLRKEDVARACEHFERAIELYSTVGLHNNAVALCKKVMRLRPGRHEMRYRLARLRLEQGFRNEAAVFLREYFENVTPDPSRLEEFEAQCREVIELLDDLAPVGKILEKLEAAELYAVAFDIVRKEAQRAADAGDDKAAARFTEKMRSLRILVERNGGRDRLTEKAPPAVAAHGATATPPAVDDAATDVLVGAPPPSEPSSLLLPEVPPAASSSKGWQVDPNCPPGLEPARVEAAGVGAAPDAAPSTEPEEQDEVESAGVGASAADTSATLADPEVETQAAVSDEAEPEDRATPAEPAHASGFESAAARLSPRDLDAEPLAAPQDATDAESESAPVEDAPPVPEFELNESSFADLVAELGPDLLRGAPAVPSGAATEWDAPPDAWVDGDRSEPAVSGAGQGQCAPAIDDDSEVEPAGEAPARGSRSPAAPPPAANWVDALRRTPLWIPPESAPPSATPDGYSSGASMELESVIDSFREQMARALDGDGAARYDLGVAYYEMGLYNEALAEFEAAAHCPGLEVQSFEMLAACLLHTGRHAEVVELLLPVLAADGHSPRGRLGLQYSLGLAYESLGDVEQARRCFEEVALVDIDFKDVQARLQRIP